MGSAEDVVHRRLKELWQVSKQQQDPDFLTGQALVREVTTMFEPFKDDVFLDTTIVQALWESGRMRKPAHTPCRPDNKEPEQPRMKVSWLLQLCCMVINGELVSPIATESYADQAEDLEDPGDSASPSEGDSATEDLVALVPLKGGQWNSIAASYCKRYGHTFPGGLKALKKKYGPGIVRNGSWLVHPTTLKDIPSNYSPNEDRGGERVKSKPPKRERRLRAAKNRLMTLLGPGDWVLTNADGSTGSSAVQQGAGFHPAMSDFLAQCKHTLDLQPGGLDQSQQDQSSLAYQPLWDLHFPDSQVKVTAIDMNELAACLSPTPPVVYSTAVLASDRLSYPLATAGQTAAYAHAMSLLRSCPMLADLGRWVEWDTVLRASLGPLPDFLEDQRVVAAGIWAMSLPCGALVRLDPSALGAPAPALQGALEQLETQQAATVLVSALASSQHLPVQLMSVHVGNALSVMPLEQACFIMLDVCTMIPFPLLLSSDLVELLLGPQLSSHPDAADFLTQACHPNHHHILRRLFSVHGLPAPPFDDDPNVAFPLGYMSLLEVQEASASQPVAKGEDPSSPDPAPLPSMSPASSSALYEPSPVLDDPADTAIPTSPKTSFTESEGEAAVASLCRERFGVGVSLGAEAAAVLDVQFQQMGRALECLSKELYTQDSHFVLELLQNADDNSYPADCVPTLHFVLGSDCLFVLNNEVGFSAADLKSVCSVGQSTKDRAAGSHIGNKGIGFKSVFRITDTPEIHSGGFHIKLSASSHPAKFIFPEWVPRSDRRLLPSVAGGVWATALVLPYRTSLVASAVAEQLAALTPACLLFLRRLQRVSVTHATSGTTRTLSIDAEDNTCPLLRTLRDGPKQMVWALHASEVHSPVDISGQPRSTGVSTTLQIALPLIQCVQEDGESSSKQWTTAEPGPLDVYAYLPLRPYGLRFIVQADFVLPSSREDMDHTSPWNQHLLSQVPHAFVTALLRVCGQTRHPDQHLQVLQLIPNEAEVLGPFRPVARSIVLQLRSAAAAPVTTVPVCGSQAAVQGPKLQLSQFKRTAICSEAARDAVWTSCPSSMLSTRMGLYWLDPKAFEYCSRPLLVALGVVELDAAAWTSLVEALVGSAAITALPSSWPGTALFALWHLLQTCTPEDSRSILGRWKGLPILPLSSGEPCASTTDGALYLPGTDLDADPSSAALMSRCGIFKKLRIVNIDALTSGLPGGSPALLVRDLVLSMGVLHLSSHTVLVDYILPEFSALRIQLGKNLEDAESRKVAPNSIGKAPFDVVGYTLFIREHVLTCPTCRSAPLSNATLAENLVVVAHDGSMARVGCDPVHLPQTMLSNTFNKSNVHSAVPQDWCHVVKHLPRWIELHSSYADFGPDGAWEAFFAQIGVTPFLAPAPGSTELTELKMALQSLLRIDDQPERRKACVAFASYIADCWEVLSSLDAPGSQWMQTLANTCWVPSVQDWVAPCGLWSPSVCNKSIFEDSVVYAPETLCSKDSLITALGIKLAPSPADLLSWLNSLTAPSARASAAQICMCWTQLEHLYSLATADAAASIKATLCPSGYPCIPIPAPVSSEQLKPTVDDCRAPVSHDQWHSAPGRKWPEWALFALEAEAGFPQSPHSFMKVLSAAEYLAPYQMLSVLDHLIEGSSDWMHNKKRPRSG
eukprot:gene7918-1413_t